MEEAARARGREFKDLPREEMEEFWNATKAAEGHRVGSIPTKVLAKR